MIDTDGNVIEPQDAPTPAPSEHCDHCAELEEKLKRYEAGWKRALADYQNARKEMDEHRSSMATMLKAYLLEQLFPVIDHFDEALEHAANEAGKEWYNGLGHVRRELEEFLRREGVESFGSTGEPFDPLMHDAVETVAEGEGASNTIVKVCSRGYRVMGRVIRPARVVVRS